MIRKLFINFKCGQKNFTLDVSYLGKHASSLENPTQCVEKLDTSIETVSGNESKQPFARLKEAVTLFVKYNINPRYYQDNNWMQCKYPLPEMRAKQYAVHKRPSDETLEQELRNFYVLALKKALK